MTNRTGFGRLVPKKSDPGLRRQKQPFVRQHFLKRWPEPQGQRSFLPSVSSSTLSPWTTRSPRLTCVSDGNPRRRLLIVSKKWLFVELFVICLSHGTPPNWLELRSRTLAVGKGSLETIRTLNPSLVSHRTEQTTHDCSDIPRVIVAAMMSAFHCQIEVFVGTIES